MSSYFIKQKRHVKTLTRRFCFFICYFISDTAIGIAVS